MAIDPTKTDAAGKPAWTRAASIADYDGATDKENCQTEGDYPYAWGWYQTYTAMLGTGLSRATTGIVHAKKLALARFEQAKTRAVERSLNNSRPGTADELLAEWATVLGVQFGPHSSRHAIRQASDARFSTTEGPTQAQVDQTVSDFLGPLFVQNLRQVGSDLDNPPAITYWPAGTPGASTYDLGGGAWISERAHLAVQVTLPSNADRDTFLNTTNVGLFQLLDRMLPAWMTFNWTTGGGFFLDISQLDFTGLTT